MRWNAWKMRGSALLAAAALAAAVCACGSLEKDAHTEAVNAEYIADAFAGNAVNVSVFRKDAATTAFREDGRGTLRLAGATFWSMPFSDLESEYRKVWQRTKDAILSGRPFWTDGRGRRHSAFPKKTESPVGHVRPHGRDAADTDVLPNGTTYTKQCFWLNRDYLRKQLGPEITKG